MAYIDIFVAPVPNANREQYKKHCEIAARLFKEYGAKDVVQCWGDDVPEGKVTSFPLAVKLKEGETVSSGWLIWPDKATRDTGTRCPSLPRAHRRETRHGAGTDHRANRRVLSYREKGQAVRQGS